jgi:hypothetical protein
VSHTQRETERVREREREREPSSSLSPADFWRTRRELWLVGGLEAAAAAAATIAVGLELFGVLSRVAGLNADARAMRGALYPMPRAAAADSTQK